MPITLLLKTPFTLLIVIALSYLLSPLFTLKFGPLGYNDARVIEIALLSIGLLFFLIRRQLNQIQIAPLTSYFLCAFFVFAWVSSIAATYFSAALQEIGLYAAIIIAIWVCRNEVRLLDNDNRERLLAGLTLLLLLIYAVQFCIYYVQIIYPTTEVIKIKLPNFQNIRSFNQLQAWLIPLAIWAIHWCKPYSRSAYYFFIGALGLWWAMLFYSSGRGVLLSLIIGFILIAYLYKNQTHIFIKPLLISFSIGVFIYVMAFYVGAEINVSYVDRIQQVHSGGRVELWFNTLVLLKDYWLFGIGPQHFPLVSLDLGHAHNMALNTAIELGIPALICIAIVIITGLWLIYKNSKSAMHIAVLCSVGTALIYSNLTAMGLTPVSQLIMILVCGFALAEPPINLSSNSSGLIAKSLPLGLFILAFAGSYISIQNVIKTPTELYINGYNNPRFWLNGHFYHQKNTLREIQQKSQMQSIDKVNIK
jgi:O-antigen ligase